MQYQSRIANEAYREIVQHTGRCVAEYEAEALKETDPDRKQQMRLAAKNMSIDGLAKAIHTASTVECNAVGLAAAFSGKNGI